MLRSRRVLTVGTILVLASVLAGCSPAIQSATFQEFEPRPTNHEIRLYGESVPQCEYVEVGTLQVTKRNAFVSIEEVTQAMQDEARKMGGEAVIGVRQMGGDTSAGMAGGAIVAVRMQPTFRDRLRRKSSRGYLGQ